MSARALRRDGGPVILVVAVWAVLSFQLLGFVLAYGVDVPFLDDWEMVPVLTGNEPVTLEWLWSQHNEHRIVLPRLLYLGLMEVSGHDFRAGAVFDALLLIAAAGALSLGARAIRGRAVYPDAFFSLVLLHWGQAENLVWGFTLPLVLSGVLAAVLLPVLLKPDTPGFGAALLLALCTAALPLISASGLALAPALSACCLVVAWQLRGAQPRPRWRWVTLAAAGLLGIAVVGLYLVGYQRPPIHPLSPSPGAILTGTVQFLAVGFGSVARVYWPAIGVFVVALVVATVLVLLRAVARSPGERFRAVRALLFLGAMGCLAVGTAWARVAISPEGLFSSRYATLAAPALCCVYLAWEVLERPRVTRAVQWVLFAVAALLLLGNRTEGRAHAIGLQQQRMAAVVDLEKGVPLWIVARRHCRAIYLCGTPVLLERMRMLRDRGVGTFANAPGDRERGRERPAVRSDRPARSRRTSRR